MSTGFGTRLIIGRINRNTGRSVFVEYFGDLNSSSAVERRVGVLELDADKANV